MDAVLLPPLHPVQVGTEIVLLAHAFAPGDGDGGYAAKASTQS